MNTFGLSDYDGRLQEVLVSDSGNIFRNACHGWTKAWLPMLQNPTREQKCDSYVKWKAEGGVTWNQGKLVSQNTFSHHALASMHRSTHPLFFRSLKMDVYLSTLNSGVPSSQQRGHSHYSNVIKYSLDGQTDTISIGPQEHIYQLRLQTDFPQRKSKCYAWLNLKPCRQDWQSECQVCQFLTNHFFLTSLG